MMRKRPFLLLFGAFFCFVGLVFGENLNTQGKDLQAKNDEMQTQSVNFKAQNQTLNSQSPNLQAQNTNQATQSVNSPLQDKTFRLKNDSKIAFKITKLAIFSIDGEFKDFGGVLKLDDSGNITALNIAVSSDSISTGKEKRDIKAKEKYLNVTDYPYIKFSFISYESKSYEKGIAKGTLTAKLTMHSKSKKVSFESVLDTSTDTPSLTLVGKINSKDFGVKGRVTSSNTVNLNLQTKWLQVR